MAKQNIVGFLQGVGAEMKKVSWPSKDQLQESTIVTIVGMLVIAALVFVVDQIFTQFFGLLF